MTQLPRPLPADQAFVVQSRAQPDGEPLRCEGRVEHLISGQESRFASEDELWTFITGMLTELNESSESP